MDLNFIRVWLDKGESHVYKSLCMESLIDYKGILIEFFETHFKYILYVSKNKCYLGFITPRKRFLNEKK
uniref:Uncharacterized protein n=1 Tax=Megaselia scalaris TaxID=36166 RepID=T1H1M4_MEGSC